MSSFTHPAQLQVANLNGSYNTNAGTQPHTPNSGVGMVHTPYSCAHDLVPEGSEVASQMPYVGGEGIRFSRRHSSQSSMLGQSNTNSTMGHSNASSAFSRRTITSPMAEHFYQHQQQQQARSSPHASQAGGAFDLWNNTGLSNSTGHSLDCSSNSSGSRTPSYRQQRQTTAQFPLQPPQDQAAHHDPQGLGQQPYPAFRMRAPIVATPVHAAHLQGKAEYLEMPNHGAEITQAAQWHRSHKVFVGHVKFEINADGLRWLIYMLTGVQAGKVEVRGMGCFMVFFATAEEVFRVRGLHKRVLFDTVGVWFAQSQVQEEQLHHYAANVAPTVHAKLPKGLMVVDEETSRRRARKVKSPQQQSVEPAAAAGAAFIAGSSPAAAHTDYDQQQQQSGGAASSAGGFHSHVAQEQQNFSAQQMWSANQ